MRGHEAVIAMRRRGSAPASIWLDDTGGPFTLVTHPRIGWQLGSNAANVEVAPDENPLRLDLRFCVGLKVHAHCNSASRLAQIEARAMECGAARVIGSLFAGTGKSPRVVRMTDTEGKFVWEESPHGAVAA